MYNLMTRQMKHFRDLSAGFCRPHNAYNQNLIDDESFGIIILNHGLPYRIRRDITV